MGIRQLKTEEDQNKADSNNPLSGQANTLEGAANIEKGAEQPKGAVSAASSIAAPSAGESADIKAPAGAGGQAKAPGQATSSGKFTSLQKYMAAAKPSKLVGAVQGKIGQEQAKATGELEKQKSEFGAALGTAQQQRADLTAKGVEAAQRLSGYEQQEQPSIENVSSALKQEYKGPSSLSSESALRGIQTDLSNLAGQTKTEAGQRGIISKYGVGPKQSAGASNLDLMLLNTNRDALRRLSQAGAEGRRFGSALEAAKGEIESKAGAEKEATKQAIEQVKGQLGTSEQALNQKLEQDIQNANIQQAKQERQFTTDEVRANLENQLKASGISDPDQIKLIMNRVDLNKAQNTLLNKQLEDYNKANFNKQAYENLRNIMSLQGGRESELASMGDFKEAGGPQYSLFKDPKKAQELANTLAAGYGDLTSETGINEAAGLGQVDGKDKNLFRHVRVHNEAFNKGATQGKAHDRRTAENLTSNEQKTEAMKYADKQYKQMKNRYASEKVNNPELGDPSAFAVSKKMSVDPEFKKQVESFDKQQRSLMDKYNLGWDGQNMFYKGKGGIKNMQKAMGNYNSALKDLQGQKQALFDKTAKEQFYYDKLSEMATESSKGYEAKASARQAQEEALKNLLGSAYSYSAPKANVAGYQDMVKATTPTLVSGGTSGIKVR